VSGLLRTLTTGRYLEAPRWRDGCLWLVDSLARTVLRISESGQCETVGRLPDVPAGLGFLPTGEVVVTAMFRRLLLRCSAGRVTTYADLASVACGTIDDMIIDGEGRAFVGDLGFELRQGVPVGVKEDSLVRVDREGHITDRIALPGRGIACALGGEDGRMLFCISAQTTHEALARGESTSRVDAVRVAIPVAGHP
jgi:sugar lactone lactonase YvrE